MSRYCCVNSCTSFWTPFTHLSFFKLPVENEQLKNKWLNVGPGYKSFTKYSKICSDHFLPEDYRILGGKRFLNKNAVPSVFKGPEQCSLNEQDCSSSSAETNRIAEMTDVSEMEYKCNVGTQVSLNNSELEDNERPRKKFGSVLVQTESRILGPSQEVKDLRHQLKLLKDRLRRKDERIVNIKKLVQRLKDRGAYGFFRTKINLPHANSLRRLVDFTIEPRFVPNVFKFLKRETQNNEYLKDVAFIFDTMAIRKQFCWIRNLTGVEV